MGNKTKEEIAELLIKDFFNYGGVEHRKQILNALQQFADQEVEKERGKGVMLLLDETSAQKIKQLEKALEKEILDKEVIRSHLNGYVATVDVLREELEEKEGEVLELGGGLAQTEHELKETKKALKEKEEEIEKIRLNDAWKVLEWTGFKRGVEFDDYQIVQVLQNK